MAKIFDKLGEMFFGNEEEYDEYKDEAEEKEYEREPVITKPAAPRKSGGRVVNIHATTQLEVAVLQPQTYEDSREIADRLKSKKAVVINLEELSKEDAGNCQENLEGQRRAYTCRWPKHGSRSKRRPKATHAGHSAGFESWR